MPKLGPNCLILPEKRCFGKIDYYYCIPTVHFHATTFQKNPQRANHKIEGCIILSQIGCKLLPQKGIFWKSWPKLLWSKCCIPSWYVISKQFPPEIMRIRLHQFWPNWPWSKKGIFLENWLIWLMSNYYTT